LRSSPLSRFRALALVERRQTTALLALPWAPRKKTYTTAKFDVREQ
jgi:hypothetical protein